MRTVRRAGKSGRQIKMKNWTSYAITAVIAVLAVWAYNSFVAPKTGLPTA